MPEIAVLRILVALDFGPASDSALEYGVALARALNATLHIVHVADAAAARDVAWARLDALVSTLAPLGVVAQVLRSAHTAPAILNYAREHEIDLILAGTHGHDGFFHARDFFMGSVAQNLVRNAPCPVMTMRGPAAAAA